MNLKPQFLAGLSELGLNLDDLQIERLLAYLSLLAKWNKHFNLTAITDPRKMLSYHLLDSLSIVGWCRHASRALDVGCGAGLPGIPLAIALPGCEWTLLDSNGKKTRFVQQVLAACAVKNATVVKSRVEDYHATGSIDIIVSRAFASLNHFTEVVTPLMQAKTILMTMKTGLDASEAAALDRQRYEQQEFGLQVPGIDEKRSLVTVTKRLI